MRLLVLGANGLLGSNLVSEGKRRNWTVFGTYHTSSPDLDIDLWELDIRHNDQFQQIVKETNIDAVVNCAAMTDVDACEDHPERANSINGRSPGQIASICDESGVEFIHVSTDYVFDGEGDGLYTESDNVYPIQAYGKSKVLGEELVTKNHDDPIIIRLSFVFGVHQGIEELEGFPAWVCSRLRGRMKTPLFTDQYITPTRAGQAAETIASLLSTNGTGLYHVASRSCVTPFQFGEELRKHLDLPEELLMPGSVDDIDRLAVRPTHSCLSVSKVENKLGMPQPTLKEEIEELFNVINVN